MLRPLRRPRRQSDGAGSVRERRGAGVPSAHGSDPFRCPRCSPTVQRAPLRHPRRMRERQERWTWARPTGRATAAPAHRDRRTTEGVSWAPSSSPWPSPPGGAAASTRTSSCSSSGWPTRSSTSSQIPNALARTDVLIGAGVLFVVEMLADKIPYVDSVWDSVHTVVRPAVGATIGYLIGHETASLDAAVGAATGGVTALISHGIKAGLRAAVNTSPEPASNVLVSTTEDVTVTGVTALAIAHPWWAATIALALPRARRVSRLQGRRTHPPLQAALRRLGRTRRHRRALRAPTPGAPGAPRRLGDRCSTADVGPDRRASRATLRPGDLTGRPGGARPRTWATQVRRPLTAPPRPDEGVEAGHPRAAAVAPHPSRLAPSDSEAPRRSEVAEDLERRRRAVHRDEVDAGSTLVEQAARRLRGDRHALGADPGGVVAVPLEPVGDRASASAARRAAAMRTT